MTEIWTLRTVLGHGTLNGRQAAAKRSKRAANVLLAAGVETYCGRDPEIVGLTAGLIVLQPAPKDAGWTVEDALLPLVRAFERAGRPVVWMDAPSVLPGEFAVVAD